MYNLQSQPQKEIVHIPPPPGEIDHMGYVGREPEKLDQFRVSGIINPEEPGIFYSLSYANPNRPIGRVYVITGSGHMLEISGHGVINLISSPESHDKKLTREEVIAEALKTIREFGDITVKTKDPFSSGNSPEIEVPLTGNLEILLGDA
ncbi:hypothetical protein HYS31_06040, partial [Candidatus Woesearchaeota archaeon]|nr:hypothetical protein [Candidatus Woesearchaeota archaeon]